jgi:hypothetical protein
LSWGSDLTSGLYRAGASDFRWVNATVELLQLTTNLVQVSGTAPVVRINESDAAANNKLWDVIATGEDMHFRVLTDALAATNWMSVTRTAGVVDLISLISTLVNVSGTTTFTSTYSANTSVAINLQSARPHIKWDETDAAVNNHRWLMGPQAEQFIAAVADDTESTITNWLQVDRTGTTVDTINFPNGTLQYASNEVGYRDLIRNNQSGNYTAVATDRGRCITYSGTGGHTFTFDNSLATHSIITVINFGSGNVTIAGSSTTIDWLNGSGTLTTGSRTLAVGGVATVWKSTAGFWEVWGVGLS